MANLIIKENGVERTMPAFHGEEIKIQTPCDCSAVTGVQIAGVEYPFYDAAGRPIESGSVLFSENSLIIVLIDTVNNRSIIVNPAVNVTADNNIKTYTSLEQLGLSEATATPKAIATTMPENSMLIHRCGGTATSSALEMPFNWGLLQVVKATPSYVEFTYTTTALKVYGYYNAGLTGNAWSGWTTRCLPLTGGALAGDFTVKKTLPSIWLEDPEKSTQGWMQLAEHLLSIGVRNVAGSGTNSRRLAIVDSSQRPLAQAVRLRDTVNGVELNYNLYGEHNLDSLVDALGGQIQLVTYTGTGTTGEEGACSVTFDFAPSIVIMLCYFEASKATANTNSLFANVNDYHIALMSRVSTTWTKGHGINGFAGDGSTYGKKSADGKTYSWYDSGKDDADNQYNVAGRVYAVLGIA